MNATAAMRSTQLHSDRTPSPATLGRWTRLGLFAFGTVALQAIEPNEWSHRQPVTIETAGVIKFDLPAATLDRTRARLEDLRFLDPAGREVPFVVERAEPAATATVLPASAFRVALRESATQITLQTGTDAPLAAITLASPAAGFLKAAQLEVSPDGTVWQLVESGLPLFRQFGAEQLRLDLGGRSARHLRITIDDSRSRPVPFTGASVTSAPGVQEAAVLSEPLRIVRREEYAGESVLTVDLGARHLTLAGLEFTTPESLFARRLTVAVRELQSDTAGERILATGSIYRLGVDGLPARAQTTLPLDHLATARELLIHVQNGDSPRLAVDEIRARVRPVRLVLQAPTAGRYLLLSGHSDAPAPRYDLATLANALRGITLSRPAIGPIELNPNFKRPPVLADAPVQGAPLDAAPWAFRKPVTLAAAGVQELELDAEVLARTPPAAPDLRLVRNGTQIPYVLERPNLSRSLELTATSVPDAKRPRVSRWEIKLPHVALPVTRFTLQTNAPVFERRFRLWEKIPDDRGSDAVQTLAEATWHRTSGSEAAPLTLTLATRPASGTLILETDNGDNPPLPLGPVQAAYPVTRLLFKTDYAPLALYYGNPVATAPRYDLTLMAGQLLTAEKSLATLGPEEKLRSGGLGAGALSAARGGIIFWLVLALVVAVLLGVVARLLPKPPPA